MILLFGFSVLAAFVLGLVVGAYDARLKAEEQRIRKRTEE